METQYKPLIEALLFISSDPITPKEIKQVVGISEETIVDIINNLSKEYDETGRGFQIRKLGKGYSISTRPEFAEYVRELCQPKIKQRLTQAALETLAIIAYKQPITRAEIEDIRGVKVEKALITLHKRGLIQELGRKHTIGTPIIYGTTEQFLQYFDLEDLSQLPDPAEFSLVEKGELFEETLHSGEREELFEETLGSDDELSLSLELSIETTENHFSGDNYLKDNYLKDNYSRDNYSRDNYSKDNYSKDNYSGSTD